MANSSINDQSSTINRFQSAPVEHPCFIPTIRERFQKEKWGRGVSYFFTAFTKAKGPIGSASGKKSVTYLLEFCRKFLVGVLKGTKTNFQRAKGPNLPVITVESSGIPSSSHNRLHGDDDVEIRPSSE